MRTQIIGGTVLLLGLLTGTAAMAQNTDWNSITCSQFTQMSPGDQASIAKEVGPVDNQNSSITSNSGTNSSAAPSSATQTVTAGQLVAACQADSSKTLHDIVSTPGLLNAPSTSPNSTNKSGTNNGSM